jgi:hypothetical protein
MPSRLWQSDLDDANRFGLRRGPQNCITVESQISRGVLPVAGTTTRQAITHQIMSLSFRFSHKDAYGTSSLVAKIRGL